MSNKQTFFEKYVGPTLVVAGILSVIVIVAITSPTHEEKAERVKAQHQERLDKYPSMYEMDVRESVVGFEYSLECVNDVVVATKSWVNKGAAFVVMDPDSTVLTCAEFEERKNEH